MDIRVQANSWQRSFVKVAGRNLSLLPLTAFKPTGKASRMSAMSKRSLGSSRAHVLAVLSDWDPQHRSQNKQNRPRSAFSFPAPSQPTDPATPRLECAALHRVPRGHALSQGTGAGPLSPAPECLVCLDHFFICRWTLRPVLKGKLQIALHTSLSFP